MDDAREIVATTVERTADTIETWGALLGPDAQAPIRAGIAVARLVAGLVRKLGVERAEAVLSELKRRVDQRAGVITDDDLERDDAQIDALLIELYGGGA